MKLRSLSKKLLAATAAVSLMMAGMVTVDVQAASELIDNGGFEKGMGTWAAFDTCTVEISTKEKFSGKNSIYATGRGTTGSGPMQEITGEVVQGGVYTVSAKVKYTEGPDERVFNLCMRSGLDWTGIDIAGTGTIKKGEWGTVEGTYTLREDADLSMVLIFLETSWVAAPDASNDLMNFYVDDVSVVAADAASEAAAGAADEAEVEEDVVEVEEDVVEVEDDAVVEEADEVEEADDAVVEEADDAEVATKTTATTSAPKTGVVSMAVIFGIGAAASATGAFFSRKKED